MTETILTNMQVDVISAEPNLRHDAIEAILNSSPAGWISSRNADWVLNFLPCEFFTDAKLKLPLVAFKHVDQSDVITNIREAGEFVWNLVVLPLMEAFTKTLTAFDTPTDNFTLTGLTPVISRSVAVPRIGECPIALECKLLQQIQLTNIQGDRTGTWVTIGRIVAMQTDKQLLPGGIFDLAATEAVNSAGTDAMNSDFNMDAFFSAVLPDLSHQ